MNEPDREKHCVFLAGKRLLSCKAQRAVYLPSLRELDAYCRNVRYASCPFYCDAEAGKTPEAARYEWPSERRS